MLWDRDILNFNKIFSFNHCFILKFLMIFLCTFSCRGWISPLGMSRGSAQELQMKVKRKYNL